MPQKNGRNGSKRPLGPAGGSNVHSCSATCGASRFATAQAEGGFIISAPFPEISHLLLPASSQAKTSGGRNGTIFLNHSSACFVASVLTVTLPSWSTSTEPWEANTAPTQSTASVVCPSGMPNGNPAFEHFSAACRKRSQVHLSANSLLGGDPAGYICVRSSPTCCLHRSIREQGGFDWLPTVAGTATQWPFCLPRYSTAAVTLPYFWVKSLTISSTGSRFSALPAAYQVGKARMSCPLCDCASAAIVSR